MIMKHISIVLLAGLAAVAFACTKETTPEQTAPEPQEMGVGGGDIVCIDGTLHFSSGEVCLNTLESLTSEESLHAFEKAHNFTSWRSFTDSMLDDIIACETPEEYQAVLETCAGYLKMDNDRLMPVITSVGYASIADINGVFYVGDVKHTVNAESVTIERTDAKTRAVEVEEIGYVAPVFDETQTRGEISQKYTDRRRETKKYKVFSRTNVLRHSVVQEVNGQKYYNTSFAIQVHVSGQKKKTPIGWNTYNDRFYIENLHWDLTIAGKRISFETYRNNYSKTESTKNLYATIGFGNGQFNMTPTEVPMPSGFNCIVHRARSREMGNCGALTDINCCMQLIQLPVSECI